MPALGNCSEEKAMSHPTATRKLARFAPKGRDQTSRDSGKEKPRPRVMAITDSQQALVMQSISGSSAIGPGLLGPKPHLCDPNRPSRITSCRHKKLGLLHSVTTVERLVSTRRRRLHDRNRLSRIMRCTLATGQVVRRIFLRRCGGLVGPLLTLGNTPQTLS